MRRHNDKKGIILGISLLAILAIGVGYAFLTTKLNINGTAITKANNWDIHFANIQVDSGSVEADDPKINDAKDTVTYSVTLPEPGDYYTFDVDIVNAGTIDAMIDVITNPSLTPAQEKYFEFSTTYSDGVDISKSDLLTAGDTETIKITIKYKNDIDVSDLPDSDQTINVTFGLTYVQADSTAKKRSINLYNMMKTNADKTTSINFKVNSKTSGTNGIYTTTETDSGSPVYYYRGSYTAINNNLIFNNMCWKIIRTTEANGVKIIYNGTPTDGKCETQTGTSTQVGESKFNETYNDNAYVGYMYGTVPSTTKEMAQTNTNNSTIKDYIDNWYTTNFTSSEVTSKLEDTVFCNDRTTKAYDSSIIGETSYSSYGDLGYGSNPTLYGATYRAWYYTNTPSPSLKCTNTNDKFTVSTTNGNGALTNPVGLITLDEAVFAGFNTYSSNTSDYTDTTNYLYTNQKYWTISPISLYKYGDADAGSIYDTGCLYSNMVTNEFGVRPVISLASSTLVNGDGSQTNPYVVK